MLSNALSSPTVHAANLSDIVFSISSSNSANDAEEVVGIPVIPLRGNVRISLLP